jgi:hypothetical protein
MMKDIRFVNSCLWGMEIWLSRVIFHVTLSLFMPLFFIFLNL